MPRIKVPEWALREVGCRKCNAHIGHPCRILTGDMKGAVHASWKSCHDDRRVRALEVVNEKARSQMKLTLKPTAPDYKEVTRDACTVITIECVVDPLGEGAYDHAEAMDRMLDSLRENGACEIVGQRMVQGNFDEVCEILMERRRVAQGT